MGREEWEANYGPPASNAAYKVGDTLFFEDGGTVENGEIVYIAATNPETGEPELTYIVSPAGDIFPRPVWPDQIISSM